MKNSERYYIIGYIGTDRMAAGKKLAEELGCEVLDTDREIERLDGRSIRKLCMIHGEHSYRNKEFELLSKLDDESYDLGLAKDEEYPDKLVVVCGDGIILDEMSLAILEKSNVVWVKEDPEILWERSKDDMSITYAFMLKSDEEERKKSFMELYELRLPLYKQAADKTAE